MTIEAHTGIKHGSRVWYTDKQRDQQVNATRIAKYKKTGHELAISSVKNRCGEKKGLQRGDVLNTLDHKLVVVNEKLK